MSPAPYPALHELLADARWVRSLARTLTQNAQDADDLAQDACLVALRQPPPHTDNLRGWFQRVLTNLVRQHARSRARRLRREQTRAGGGGHGAATDDLVERAATHRSVVDAVLALEQPYRDTILLRFFEDLPPRAIAARMAVPVATVHSRLQRGCASLRAQLDRSSGPRPWRAALLPLPVATPLPSLGVLLMNAKIASVAATVVVGTAALWYALQSGGTADVPVQTDEVAAARPGTKTAAAPAPEAGAPTDRVRATPPAADAAARPAPLPDRRAIAGRVVDAEGRSAADVQMAFADARARSDRAGAFTLETTDHERGLVRTDDPRWQTVLSSVVPDGATPPRALVVAAPTLTLAGLVREAGGPAVAGALLQIAWPADLRSRIAEITDACTEETVTARTGSDGAFHLTGAAVRSAALVVTAEGFVPQRLTLPERDDTSLHVELERLSAKPGTIQGQVVDAHGLPVAGARIGLGPTAVRADAQGNFLIDDDGKARTLAATAAGHRRGVVERGDGGFARFVVMALGGEPMSIRGRVVDQDGVGLEGISIWASDPTLLCETDEPLVVEGIAAGCTTMGELRERFERGELANPEQFLRNTPTAAWPWVRSAADGSFELGGLEERGYRLRAMDPVTLLLVERDKVPAGAKDARLVLRRDDLFTTLKGTVVSRRGEPIAGVRVMAQIDTLRAGRSTMHGRSEASDTTDARGRFTLPNVPKSHVYLRLDGEAILPVEYGRGVAGGLLELTGGRSDDVRIEAGVRMHVQVELLDPASADSIVVLDGRGETITVNVFSGHGRRETNQLPLVDGKSPVFVVPDSAATLVLHKGDHEVRREALQLRAGGVNALQF